MTATTGSSASSTSSAQGSSVASSAVPAVRIEDVSKRFRIYHHRNQSLKGAILQRSRGVYEDFWALKDITFDIPEGLSLIHISEPTRRLRGSRMPSSA